MLNKGHCALQACRRLGLAAPLETDQAESAEASPAYARPLRDGFEVRIENYEDGIVCFGNGRHEIVLGALRDAFLEVEHLMAAPLKKAPNRVRDPLIEEEPHRRQL
jgi:hypothetical protein